MRILVIGSSGFIGSHLVPHLKSVGHEVHVLKRSPERSPGSWDPERGIVASDEFEGFDAIINLAGENVIALGWTEEKKRRIYESRVTTTNLIGNAIKVLKEPPKIFLCASACGIYGSREGEMLDERSAVGVGFLATVCKDWEAQAERIALLGIRTCMLRFGVVLGKDGGVLKKLILPFRLGLGGSIGSGAQWMSWITIDDVLRSISFLLESSITGAVNVVSPNPLTNSDFTKMVAKALKRPAFCRVPSSLLRLVCGQEADELFLSSERVLPKVLLEAGFIFQDPQLTLALLQKLLL